jgi:hypothetical protein
LQGFQWLAQQDFQLVQARHYQSSYPAAAAACCCLWFIASQEHQLLPDATGGAALLLLLLLPHKFEWMLSLSRPTQLFSTLPWPLDRSEYLIRSMETAGQGLYKRHIDRKRVTQTFSIHHAWMYKLLLWMYKHTFTIFVALRDTS